MVGQGGAGASVSSGAGFQARVGAYAMLASICGLETAFGEGGAISRASFETRTSIDDLVLQLRDGSHIFVQAKATIDFSLTSGELKSVFEQFDGQDGEGGANESYLLVTSSRASKKVTGDLRAALDAFRTSPANVFYRDQPKALTDVITDLRSMLSDQRAATQRSKDPEAVDRVIRKSGVLVLDVDAGDPLEQAMILVLQARGYAAPAAVWGKAIADCVAFAKTRRTVAIEQVTATFERYRVPVTELPPDALDDILKVEWGDLEPQGGKEVVLLKAIDDSLGAVGQFFLMEFFRFDEDCNERLDFTGAAFTLPNGAKFEVLLRAATTEGMARLLKERPELGRDRPVYALGINSDEDPNGSPCAVAQAKRLQAAIRWNEHLLQCLHCGQPVSQPLSQMVELGEFLHPIAGLVHSACLKPTDRVIGGARSPFSEQHPELVNFGVNAWFRSVNGGQRAFHNLASLRAGPVVNMAWGGRGGKGPPGQFLVEVVMKNGDLEIVTQRNNLHRFSKGEADAFVSRLNGMFSEAASAGDPFCYTDQSKGFGRRSLLIEQFGARESRREVSAARVRPFEQRLVGAYSMPGQWYAPLLSLRYRASGDPVAMGGAVMLLTNPIRLRDHLENWAEAGMNVEDYELVTVLTDSDFDDFMRWVEDHDHVAVVDALVDPKTGTLISGVMLLSIERLEALAKEEATIPAS